MELYQLNTFVKIADEGSLTRAAELLFTSQPAISAQIKALEEELGVALFDRSSRGMQLTAKGRLLYDQAVETLNSAAKLKSQAQQLQQELVGELRIGVHTDFEFMRIGELHRRLQSQHPRVSPHFVQSMSSQILPDIHRGVLDGGFFFGPCRIADLSAYGLAEVPMRIVGPADWGERIATASLQDLAQLPWIYTSDTCPLYVLTQQLFASLDSVPERVAYVDSEDAVRELVRAGAGLSILRADDAARMEASGGGVSWTGDTLGIELGFAVRRQRAGEPLVSAMQTLIAGMWIDSPALAGSAGS
jgi:DNA-binding transcriptional LysR family regulator